MAAGVDRGIICDASRENANDATGVDRGTVRRAAAGDMETAKVVDRGAVRRAAAGDIHATPEIDRGDVRGTAIKYGHEIISVQDDAAADFAAGNNVVHHLSLPHVVLYLMLN